MLERHGLATDAADGWRLSATNDLGDAASIWRTVLEEEPELGADLALAAAAAEALPRVFREGLAAAPPPSAALLEQVLYDSPAGRRATEALLAGVASVAAQWPRGRRLRILEIGAGGGVFSRRLLRQLKAWPGRATYVAADPDPDAVGRLSLLLGAHAQAACWDPQAGGAPPGRFDVIVSAYGLTRLGLDEDGLGALRGALADGGVLLTAEPTPNAAWDVLFGGDERWWRASLTPEFPRRPIEDADGWRAKLARAAFMAQPAVLLATAPWDAAVLAARRIGAEAERTEPRRGGAVVIANSGGGLATRLAARLSGKDLPVHVLDLEGAEASPFAEALAAADGAILEVLALPTADPARPADAGARLAGVLQAARAASEAGGRVRLWIVTGGAQQDQADPVEAAVWGLGRTLANESSELDVRLVDLPGLAGSAAANRLAAEILSPDAETEIVWTHEGRHVLRLERGLPDVPQPAGPVELDAAQPGLLDSLAWKAAPPREPGEGEVAIEVRAAGLNFRDVMWALGLLPEEALIDGFAGATFGLECAGVISAVGPGVGDLAVGQRVAAFAPASLASRAVTAAHAVAPIPDSLSFAAAATIPVAYLTVVYALGRLAELAPGETVLIHGGAGGVGLAAIQYAKHRGAVVIATAGSEVKRAFLRQCGADHVFDSRSLAFVDAVRGATCGEGVDVVLNSLNGEAMERSLGLLKPFGRFLELGKRDFYMDTRVGLRPLRQNVSYFAIDADRLPLHRPALAKALLAEAMALIGSGALRPLPHRTLPFAEASHAFRLMQAAGHIGKLVLTPEPPQTAAAQAPRAFPVRADATYLVSGGLAGFGLETAKWLVDRGARHLALLGRRGADTPGAAQALAMLEEAGVEARAFACDVADEAGVAATLAEIRRTMPPLRGVVHAAMVVDDGLLSDLTRERIETVLAPKLAGALNLDRLTADDPIELFLLYSSATTVLGAPGQGSYVAANMALEALARRRAARGLPALSIAWGPVADVGLLARQEAARDELARRLSATPLVAREALDALPALWASRLPVAAYAAVQWDAVQRRLPIFASPTFAGLAKAAAGDMGEIDLAERLASLSPQEAQTFVTGLLTEEIARILSSSPDRIDAHRPLSELGMDSLMALELRMTLENRLGVSLPLLTLSDTTTLAGIAARVVAGLSGVQAEAELVAEAIVRHELADPRDAGVETAPMDMPMSTAAE